MTGREHTTLDTVARALGVSRATVSNAYNRPDQLSAALRQRVLDTAQALGYSGPDPVARGLARRRAGVVGLLLSEPVSYVFADPGAREVLDGLSAVLSANDLGLLLLPADVERRGSAPTGVTSAPVDAFLAYSLPADDPGLSAALARRLPVVALDQPRRRGLPVLRLDDRGGARRAAVHLTELGHRRVAVISMPLAAQGRDGPITATRIRQATYPVSTERLAGYRQGLATSDLVPSTVWECARNDPAHARRAAAEILSHDPRPTAVLAGSDVIALTVINHARQLGMSVPGDLSVIGFDDIHDAAEAHVPLTTISQHLPERGKALGTATLQALAGDNIPTRRTAPTTLTVRATTGPPPAPSAAPSAQQ